MPGAESDNQRGTTTHGGLVATHRQSIHLHTSVPVPKFSTTSLIRKLPSQQAVPLPSHGGRIGCGKWPEKHGKRQDDAAPDRNRGRLSDLAPCCTCSALRLFCLCASPSTSMAELDAAGQGLSERHVRIRFQQTATKAPKLKNVPTQTQGTVCVGLGN